MSIATDMEIPEWVTLCAPFFACAVVCVIVLARRVRAVLCDAALAFGGMLVIALNKEIFEVRASNMFTAHFDHFCVMPMVLGTANLLLAALRCPARRALWWFVTLSFCCGVFIEFAYPHFHPAHIGGDWVDIGVYVAGGIAAWAVYKTLRIKGRVDRTSINLFNGK
ncbi:MAG: hypothetical protein FWG05_03805 [Kiritimatiellaeota bacterium]|nr:hypothetical protein [Kiritimatiellota bacterium]